MPLFVSHSLSHNVSQRLLLPEAERALTGGEGAPASFADTKTACHGSRCTWAPFSYPKHESMLARIPNHQCYIGTLKIKI